MRTKASKVWQRMGRLVFAASLALGLGFSAVGVALPALAEEAPKADMTDKADPVLTRARLLSVFKEDGNRLYVRLKLLPHSKLPFATQTLRVADRALVADIPEGAWVKFTARRMDGENTVTAIQVVDECKRFQPCD